MKPCWLYLRRSNFAVFFIVLSPTFWGSSPEQTR